MDEQLMKIAASVKGFMPTDEGLALYEEARAAAPHGVVVEIGSYCGKSAVYIGAACQEVDGVLVTVDHHRGSEETQPGWEWHDPSVIDPRTGRMDTLPFLRRTLEDAGLESSVVPIVGESTTVARFWRTPIAMLLIDGGHAEDIVQSDYDAWAPWVAVGGKLVFHDIFESPEDGGQAPWRVYQRALATGAYEERRIVGSLRVLERVHG